MLQGEAVGVLAVTEGARWAGPWRAGVRPGQGLRVMRPGREERPEGGQESTGQGSRVR